MKLLIDENLTPVLGQNVAEVGVAAQLFGRLACGVNSRATSTNARSAGDTWARLGKYRKNPGTAAA